MQHQSRHRSSGFHRVAASSSNRLFEGLGLAMLGLALSGCDNQAVTVPAVPSTSAQAVLPSMPAPPVAIESEPSPVDVVPGPASALDQGVGRKGFHVAISPQGIRTYSGGSKTPIAATASSEANLDGRANNSGSDTPPPPQGVTTDAAGNTYIEDPNGTVSQVTPGGQVMVLDADNLANLPDRVPVSGDSGTVARDASGNVYIEDPYNHTVRQVAPDGTSTMLGRGTAQEMMRRQQ